MKQESQQKKSGRLKDKEMIAHTNIIIIITPGAIV
jgi:hypothetical protein